MSALRARTLLILALLTFATAGCSRPGAELARVGSHVVTSAEFEDIARGNEVQYPGTEETARRAFLDDVIRRQVMLESAKRRGDDTTGIARRFRANLEAEIAQLALIEDLSPQSVKVTDAEIAALHAARAHAHDVSLIFTTDRGLLAFAQQQLAGGTSFEQVANRVNSPGMLPPGGAMGPTLVGQLVPPLDSEMARLRVGEVGGPYETPQGFFLLKVNGREERELGPLALQQSALGEAIRQRKQRQGLTERLTDLRSAYRVRLEPDGGQALYEAIANSDAGDRTRVIARWSGGVYTMADAVADMDRERDRPAASMLPALQGWIENMVMKRVIVAEANRRHLLELPQWRRALRARWEEFLLEGVYNSAIAGVRPPDEARVREIFEASRSQFARLQRAHVYRLMVADSARAFAVANTGGRAGNLPQVAAAMDPSLKVEEITIAFPTDDPEWQSMEAALLRLPPLEWFGPVRLLGGWLVFQLVDREVATPGFDQLEPGLRQRIASTAMDMERDRVLAAFTDSLAQGLGVNVNEANLARQPWPVPPILKVGP